MNRDRKKEEESDISPWVAGGLVCLGAAVGAGVGYWAGKKLLNSDTSRRPVQHNRRYFQKESYSSRGARRPPMKSGQQYLYDESDDDDLESLSRRTSFNSFELSSQRRLGLLPTREKPSDVGVRFNKWRKPEAFFGPTEHHMEAKICSKLGLVYLDIDSELWRKATDRADKILEMLFSEVVRIAAGYRLNIDKFVRQGSAREGLKVCAADEFDVLLQFSIEGLNFEVQQETDIPDIGKLRVSQPTHGLYREYRKLWSANVFTVHGGQTYLNSRNLHEKVFTSIIDKARLSVARKLQHTDCDFVIGRAINQPAIKIGIKIKKQEPDFKIDEHVQKSHTKYVLYHVSQDGGTTRKSRRAKLRPMNLDVDMNIDIVPALLICYDQVPDPAVRHCTMDCPRYAVFKWVRDNHPFVQACDVQPDSVWRIDSSGYEKHVLDVARGNTEQRYILTAHRVLKAYFLSAGRAAHQPQLVTVLKTYFLKQLAFYCILFYTVTNKFRISGVRQALTILIDLLEICLTVGRLPHFFHTNWLLLQMFPDYHMDFGAIRYDVFHTISRDSLVQARLDVGRHLRPMLADFTCDLDDEALAIEEDFRQFIEEGRYLTVVD